MRNDHFNDIIESRVSAYAYAPLVDKSINFLSLVSSLVIPIPYLLIPYYPAFRCMHLYTKQAIFVSGWVVSYIGACTKLCGYKCMHQYTKHI